MAVMVVCSGQKTGVAVQVGEQGQRDHHGPQGEERQPCAQRLGRPPGAAPRQQVGEELGRPHEQEDALRARGGGGGAPRVIVLNMYIQAAVGMPRCTTAGRDGLLPGVKMHTHTSL